MNKLVIFIVIFFLIALFYFAYSPSKNQSKNSKVIIKSHHTGFTKKSISKSLKITSKMKKEVKKKDKKNISQKTIHKSQSNVNEIKLYNQKIRELQNYILFKEHQLRISSKNSTPVKEKQFKKYLNDIEAHRKLIRHYRNMVLLKQAKEREKIMREMYIKKRIMEMKKLKELQKSYKSK